MRVDRLKAVREQRQLTQRDLANRVGISDQQIYRYESGSNEPTADILTRISQELEVSSDFLLGLVDRPNDHLREEDLSPMERKLVQAVRSGRIRELFEILATLPEPNQQGNVPRTNPTINS